MTQIKVEDLLNEVDYGESGDYEPSQFAIEFIEFIKLVNGAEGESHKSPVVHYRMLDNLIEDNGKDTINMCHRGMAKAVSLDTQLPTPEGNIRMEDIKVGDWVYSREGNPTRVTNKSATFNKPMYLITLEDGRKVEVSEDHLNVVQKRLTGKRTKGGFSERSLTTLELLDSGVTYSRKVSDRCPSGYETKWYVPTSKCIELPTVTFPIEPYTVGCILGDGSIDKQTGFTRIHTHEGDLKHFLNNVQGACSDSVRSDLRRESTKRFSLKGLGSLVKEFIGTENVYSKRIPQKLLWGSKEQRLDLLKGLMDTDGTCYNNSSSYTTVSEGLANDVMWLARSLGFESKLGDITGSYKVYIYADECIFKLPRKALRWKSNKKGRVGIKSIESIGQVPSQCIAVRDITESYLVNDFFVTHNTTLLGEYLFLYLAVFGWLPNFGKVDLAIYVSDSIENGVKNMRKNLEFRWENSEFLKKYIPKTRFTDVRYEFENIDGKKFIVKGYGAKALSLDTKLYTESGYTTIGAVQVGDSIFGPDGQLARVNKKSEVFHRPMYEITLGDGRTLKVSEDHINSIVHKGNVNNSVTYTRKDLDTLELLDLPLQHVRVRKRKGKEDYVSREDLIFIENTLALEYSAKDFILDPYTLGLLLGDGSIKADGSSVLHAHKDDMVEYLPNIPYVKGKPYLDKRNNNVISQSIKGISSICRELGIVSHGDYKRVPSEYLFGSIEQRLELLKGLLDSDGSISPKGRIDFCSNSEGLVQDVMDLVRSLGGTAKKRKTGKAFRIEIWIDYVPFKLKRKALRFKNRSKNLVAVKSILPILEEPSQCIAIENEDRQFIAGEYFRTHNTGVRGAKEMGMRPQLAVLDDLVSDEDARSATVIESIEATVDKAIEFALDPARKKVVWSGTPFNSKDPLYKAVESGAYNVNVYPVCKKYPCEREDFEGSWEDRFGYDYVKSQYDKLKLKGNVAAFNQELMLRIMSEDDRLVQNNEIKWYNRNDLMRNIGNYNIYITTDFATSEKTASDYSVISVWGINSNNDWYWIDGVCRRQLMDANINDLFYLAAKYKPMSVGVEVSGQQGGFIPWIQKEMMDRNCYFTLASENNSNNPGIRPTTNKMQRFNVVVPWFKAGKMYFPNDMRQSAPMRQFEDEIGLVSPSGFKSKHDDFSDTISMLPLMNTWAPGAGTVMVENNNGLWGEEDDYDEGLNYQSYLV